MSGWKTVDSVPENTKILAWIPPDEGAPGICVIAIRQRDEELVWWSDDEGYEIDDLLLPTHWMTLPEPPQ
jgi:hypothetical protein